VDTKTDVPFLVEDKPLRAGKLASTVPGCEVVDPSALIRTVHGPMLLFQSSEARHERGTS
jgi:hypothetical protein